MDVPTGAGGPSDRFPAPSWSSPSPEVMRRLDAIDASVAGLAGRVEALAASLEAVVHAAVASEVRSVADELRHTVSELGRILARDLGKLPQMLTSHRQAIVTELSTPTGRDRGRHQEVADRSPAAAGRSGASGGEPSERRTEAAPPPDPDGTGDRSPRRRPLRRRPRG